MADLNRRSLIAAAAAAASAAPAVSQAAIGGAPSKLSDIDHFIILMKENRSFDHYFGAMRGVRGFDDPTARRPEGGSLLPLADKAMDHMLMVTITASGPVYATRLNGLMGIAGESGQVRAY